MNRPRQAHHKVSYNAVKVAIGRLQTSAPSQECRHPTLPLSSPIWAGPSSQISPHNSYNPSTTASRSAQEHHILNPAQRCTPGTIDVYASLCSYLTSSILSHSLSTT